MPSLLASFKHTFLDLDGILLRNLAGDRLKASHSQERTFEEHLLGTRRVLAAWGQSTTLQRAGLCHSLYSTDAFEHSSVSLANRGRVQAAIGKQSEELVFLFCAVQRASFFRTVLRADSFQESTRVPIEVREGFEAAGQTITGVQARDLLILHMANFVEQAGGGTKRPTLWLEQFHRLAKLLADKYPDTVPPVLKSLLNINGYAERHALSLYMRALRTSASPETSIPLMEAAAELLLPIPDPHVWLAWFWHKRGDQMKRRYHSRLAKEKLDTFGAAWDKRLSFGDWRKLAQIGGRRKVPEDGFGRLAAFIIANETTPYSEKTLSNASRSEARETGSRFENYLLDVAESKTKRVSGFYPGLRMNNFWPSEQFEISATLSSKFYSIREEIIALNLESFHDEAEKIERTGKWQVLMLLEAGRWHEDNLRQLPVLSKILRESKELRLAGGLVYLSRLSPGTVVSPHTGPTNMRLRLHFAIKVPDGDCGMRVDGIELFWEEGKTIVFNDFLKHEVWNRTCDERIVLLIDIWHPDITLIERKMLEAIHWMAEQHGSGLFEYWKKNAVVREESRVDQIAQIKNNDDLVL